MANTLKDVGEFLAERAGRQLDVPFQRQMHDLVILKRARFLTNTLEKKTSLSRFFLQAFDADIIKIDITAKDCEDALPEGCDIAFKTVLDIPVPLKIGVHPFDYVGAPGGHKSYGYTTFGSESTMRHSKYTGKKPRYAYINDKLYIFNEPNSNKIRIEGVFSDPRDLAPFMKCGTDKPCFSETENFPIDGATLELVIQDIMAKELRVTPREEDLQVKVDQNV